jgi:hypothetical protein
MHQNPNPIPSAQPHHGLFASAALTLLQFLVNVLIMIGPVIAYVKQYSLIKKTKKVGAFSYDVCAILLFGQAFRIFFWYFFPLCFFQVRSPV